MTIDAWGSLHAGRSLPWGGFSCGARAARRFASAAHPGDNPLQIATVYTVDTLFKQLRHHAQQRVSTGTHRTFHTAVRHGKSLIHPCLRACLRASPRRSHPRCCSWRTRRHRPRTLRARRCTCTRRARTRPRTGRGMSVRPASLELHRAARCRSTVQTTRWRQADNERALSSAADHVGASPTTAAKSARLRTREQATYCWPPLNASCRASKSTRSSVWPCGSC